MRHLIVTAVILLCVLPVHAVTLEVTSGTVQSSEHVAWDTGVAIAGDDWSLGSVGPFPTWPFGDGGSSAPLYTPSLNVDGVGYYGPGDILGALVFTHATLVPPPRTIDVFVEVPFTMQGAVAFAAIGSFPSGSFDFIGQGILRLATVEGPTEFIGYAATYTFEPAAAAVPEASTFALLGTGILLIGLKRR